ncbi:unnamed protein product [Orchesella dallaii]|uniref:FAD-binding PCMH-type domain-containing protein n=1 Tax=Orchesella dallaii TaxID=48710 RepID=A0ABP1RZM4_9HEXA
MKQNRSSGFSYTSYQQGQTCNAARAPFTPTSLEELQEIVQNAARNNYTLKALGNRHSTTDMICTEGVPIHMDQINHFNYDVTTELARVGAGSTVYNFMEQLHKNGRTIYGLPSYGDVTVGGATGTSGHGSNLRGAATISDQIVSVIIVDGLGNIRNVTDPETIRAFRVHLGLLGIIYELTIKTVPQFKLHIRNYPVPDRILWSGGELTELIRSNEHFQFWWFPTAREVILSVGNSVPISTPGNCQTYLISESPAGTSLGFATAIETMQEGMDHLGMFLIQGFTKLSLYQQVIGKSPIFTEDGKTLCNTAVGFNHRMVSNRCNECAWNHGNASLLQQDYEIIVPLSELQGALHTLRSIMQEQPVEFPLTGIYFRFLSSSDALMSINSDQESVAIEWMLVPRADRYSDAILGLPSIQAFTQAVIEKHKGRTHWAKNGLYFTNPQLVREKYEHLPTFVRHMEEFDPQGIFLNDFGRRIRFDSETRIRDPRVKHCALLDHCICRNDLDCGDGSGSSYRCNLLQGYRVCRENPKTYEGVKGQVLRDFLNLIKPDQPT